MGSLRGRLGISISLECFRVMATIDSSVVRSLVATSIHMHFALSEYFFSILGHCVAMYTLYFCLLATKTFEISAWQSSTSAYIVLEIT